VIFTNIRNKLLLVATLIGNTLDHYDSALYIFLAPFIAPLFFPDTDPSTALILTYGIKSVGIITRPLGAIIFGFLASKYPAKNILALTLAGVSVCTFCIGILPTYLQVGVIAPLLLCIFKAIQGIFASGEHTIAALFFIEQAGSQRSQARASSYYFCSVMFGALFASCTATLVASSSNPEFYWRIAFFSGVVTGIFGLIVRLSIITPLPSPINAKPAEDITYEPKTSSINLIYITIISSFSFLTYTLPFIFFNNFIPLFSDFKFKDLLPHNNILLAIDICLLPIFGIIADKIGATKVMLFASFCLSITILPIFYFLPNLNLIQIMLVKLWIVLLGVAFAAPINALFFRMLKKGNKYFISGLGYAIGTELLGKNIPAVCLLLWQVSHSTIVPGIYVSIICIATIFVIVKQKGLD
jgi:MFS family permease